MHYHGLSAENGVDMTILHKHHKQLVARGAHVRAGMLYKIATAQINDGSRVCEHGPPAPKLLVPCAGHLMTQCFISFTIARASLHPSSWTKRIVLSTKPRTKAHSWSHLLVPWSSRRGAGTLGCQSQMTRSLRILARCTSWAVMFSQMGVGELRPKTPASGTAVMVSHGSSLMVAC